MEKFKALSDAMVAAISPLRGDEVIVYMLTELGSKLLRASLLSHLCSSFLGSTEAASGGQGLHV
jgi:hypothetical protein